jgi:hypothetical protein
MANNLVVVLGGEESLLGLQMIDRSNAEGNYNGRSK